jgi:excisionase family DNA binding protein
MRPQAARRDRRSLDELPDLLSIAEVAEALGVGAATVRNWLNSGELVSLDLSGDRRLLPKQQIRDLIDKADARRRNCGEAP